MTFSEYIVNFNIIQFGNFTLKSGRKVHTFLILDYLTMEK